MTKRITLLLGAGAAKPWGGKLTNELTKILVEKDEFKTISGEKLSQYLISKLAIFHNCETEKEIIHFENLLYVLELLYEHYSQRDQQNPPHFRPDSPAVFEVIEDIDLEMSELPDELISNETSNSKKATFIYRAFISYLDIIYSEISSYSEGFIQPDFPFNSKLKNFIAELSSKGLVRAYTLNYDNFLSDIMANSSFFNGFRKNDLDQLRYDYSRIINSTNEKIFYNLHGSFNYQTISIKNDHLINYELGYQNISLQPSISINGFGSNDEHKRRLISTPIITGQQKLLHTLVEPFNAFFHAFRYDSLNCDLLISIGYSYTDGHINDCILNGMIANRDQKILNVTFERLEGKTFDQNDNLRFFGKVLDDAGRLVFYDSLGKDGFLISKSEKEVIYYNGFNGLLDLEDPLTYF